MDTLDLVLLILLLVMGVFLIIAVLMQQGKSHGLSGSITGGAETFFGKEKGGRIGKKLSRLTTVVGIIFVVLVVVVFAKQPNYSYNQNHTFDKDGLSDYFGNQSVTTTGAATTTTVAPGATTTANPAVTTANPAVTTTTPVAGGTTYAPTVTTTTPVATTASPAVTTTTPAVTTTTPAVTPAEVPVLTGTAGLTYEDNSEGGKSVSRGQSDAQDVIVMTTNGGKNVTAVAANGFNPLYSSAPHAIKSVNLQKGITKIGAAAFSACNELTYVVLPATLEEVGNQAFWGCDALDAVYYGGTAEQWADVDKGTDNEALVEATLYYYSETQPTGNGNYWHYVNNVPTAW